MWFRIFFGFPFVYLLSGFPLARLCLPKEKVINLKLVLTSFAFSLFLTYPAAVLTTIFEGQSAVAIYSIHLPTSLLSLLLVSLPFWLWSLKLKKISFSLPKPNIILIFLVLIYFILTTVNLNKTNILGDDYDLAYQAYNLQDGILAARKAYIISFNTHPPLFMTIKHFALQLFSPWGLETLFPWMYRGMESLMGIGIILTVYLLVKEKFNQNTALFAAALLAVNNYLVFLGRVELREIYLTFFLTICLYFFTRKNVFLAAFFLGCAFLIKTPAIILLPIFLFKYRRALLITLVVYFPVLFYNLLAYVTTGHMDATFSRIFGLPHPFLTGSSSPLTNIFLIKDYLSDIYSLPVLLTFILAATLNLRSIYFLILLSSLFYFVFTGPLREYYLLFLTIPFAILTVDLVLRHSGLSRIVFVCIFFYSFWYSISNKSITRQIYEPNRGWPELVSKVAQIYTAGDCLQKGAGVNDLAMRAYFQTDDAVKKALLGSNHPHYYKMCDEVATPKRRIEIFNNQMNKVEYKIL